ncbi:MULTISPECIES: tyrosine-protein phosphatase [unclassified Polaribacter]|uniref:tyrosine-protein phosphatase n=1 Tax=unclassified Polaribacter TaxID=196858 RepID=UPI0011BD64A0|nr:MULTISPECIES: CpsB/CapC family capsule biosynthesis tyrosine phosphatase [unclassified Polaribacter]TXD47803.1 histidinol phosphatase [Polaribacter sp. IC063]TXD55429.1 histidinol phosphatase [Polaribacter sp. IC066]
MHFFKKKILPLHNFFPEDFVDIHSHLLPGIDDGAKDLNDSISLIQKMSSFGITNFITTPHILGDLYPNTPEIINGKLKLVQDELLKRDITNISIHAAAEYMIDEKFTVIMEEENLLTLKDNLVLVEMSYYSPPINLYEILFQLQLKGYKPILAHPERYFSYHKDFQSYYKLKNAGCLFQLNLLSLTEQYGKHVQKVTKRLLKENLYDFVGTDTHHEEHLQLLETIATDKNLKNIEQLLLNNKRFLK